MRAEPVEALEQRPSLLLCQPLQGLGHQRGRCERDGTALALEGAIGDDAFFIQRQVDEERVTTHGVVPMGAPVRVVRVAEVTRVLAVIENDFLIEFAKFIEHQPKSSLTLCRAATSASTSASVL